MTLSRFAAALVAAIFASAACGTASEFAREESPRGEDAGSSRDTSLNGDTDLATLSPDASTVPPGDVGEPIQEAVLAIPDKRVGIFYSVWDGPAAAAMARIKAAGILAPLTVEDILRSGGAAKVSDLLFARGEYDAAAGFHYHATPSAGFYCLYRARPGEASPLPDCPNISATAKRHAEQLITAGIDYVVLDATNLSVLGTLADQIQLRPAEVLAEEWSALRKQGTLTPEIAIWGSITGDGANIWSEYLKRVYNEPAFDHVIMRDKKSGKKLFFAVDGGRADLAQAMESNGGKNDIKVVWMWGNMDPSRLAAGIWSFMSPCVHNGYYSPTIVGRPCDQYYTPASPLGSQMAVSASYLVNFASRPFGSPGKMEGATLRKQFVKAYAVHPDYLFLNGWNEFIAQPQTDPPTVPAMGLDYEPPGDPLYGKQWVDAYGVEFSRAMEPTKEEGDGIYQLLRSCLRVYRTGATSCTDPAEPCCSTAETYNDIYSLEESNGDRLLTGSTVEKSALLGQGNWTELCAPYGGPTSFCVSPGESGGPFMLYANPGAARKPLVRCLLGAGHFMSIDAACEGQIVEGPIGFVSQGKTSATPRSLRRCYRNGHHRHVLDGTCPDGSSDDGILGYVR